MPKHHSRETQPSTPGLYAIRVKHVHWHPLGGGRGVCVCVTEAENVSKGGKKGIKSILCQGALEISAYLFVEMDF